MRSPNSKRSFNNLDMAKKLVRNAWEDLKNDPSVRNAGLHIRLYDIENEIVNVLSELSKLGYE